MTASTPPLSDLPIARRGLASPTTTAWGYIRHELLFLGFALMEIAILTPVVMVIMSWARYWPAYLVSLWLLLVMVLPLNLIRLMSLAHFDVKRQRRVMIVALLLVILLSWRLLLYTSSSPFDLGWLRQFAANLAEGGNLLWTRDLSVFLVTTFMWWRGIRLAVRLPEINNVGLRLRLGGLVLLPLIVWFSSGFVAISIVPFVLMFFLAALTVVSLVRAENIEQERSGTAATLNTRWFIVVFGAALAIVFLGAVIAAFISGDSLLLVLGWLSPLWHSLQFGLTVTAVTLFEMIEPALGVFSIFVQLVSRLLAAVLSMVSNALQEANILPEQAAMEIPTPTATTEVVVPVLAGKALTTVIMLGLIALVALALARAYLQTTFAARNSDRSQVDHADTDEPGLGRRMLERLGLLRQWRAAASVRRIYRLMCQAAASSGYPRLEAETPYEYIPTLARVWPEQAAESRLITEAFIRVRYGEIPETDEELEAIREAWRRLETTEPRRRETAADTGPTLARRDKPG
jgi:hypothetical protein